MLSNNTLPTVLHRKMVEARGTLPDQFDKTILSIARVVEPYIRSW